MNPKLYSNKELSDYTINDSFNFITKADAIKIFLEQNVVSLNENKMIVLYGDWGSGKTSLMKHIEETIDKKIYKPIFFHAWEHEKDENLALSLCDALSNCLDETAADLIKPFMKGALLTLKGFTNAITFKSSHLLAKLGLEFEFSGEKFNAVLDKAFDDNNNQSFYTDNKEFKESFIAIENQILEQHGAKKILIFVDDLDRCEPENVLNLITALKLFFTYGEKSVFFCGIDKEAVTKAVKTKYKDVIKSEEYMEKVFDIAFNMPKTFSLVKMLLPYFGGTLRLSDNRSFENAEIIEDFFKSIKFTNPRHLKKIINKYEILKSFKTLNAIPTNLKSLIPDIVFTNNAGNVFELIYCLYIIILYEFFPDDFKDIEDYKRKMTKYADIIFQSQSGASISKGGAATTVENSFFIEDLPKKPIYKILQIEPSAPAKHPKVFSKFLYIFSNSQPSSLDRIYDHELNRFDQHFLDDEISSNFCRFLIKHHETIMLSSKESNYKIWDLFEMVKYLL